ncbi:hypothetical protein [Gordonia sputi]
MSTASSVKSGSVHALITGAFASVVGGAANGLSTFLVGQHMASVVLLEAVLISTAVVVLAVRFLLVALGSTKSSLTPMLSGMVAGLAGAALLLSVGL